MGTIPRKTLTAYHRINGAHVNGLWVEGTRQEFTFSASVQPLTGREMDMLEEGRRTKQSYKLYTDSFLNTVEGQNPDIVIIDNEEYEVVSRFNWQNNIIMHFKYFVTRLDK